jgi:hypothetical protein
MNTAELVLTVRDKLLEYMNNPASDALIIRHMNSIYKYIYNYYSRSQDNMFGKDYSLKITANQTEYDLPKDLWNKRIQSVHAPIPNNDGIVFQNVEKMNRNDSYLYEVNRGTTLVPSSYVVYDNKLKLMTRPGNSYDLRLFVTPLLVPLGKTEGVFLEKVGNDLEAVDEFCADLLDIATYGRGKNIASISDSFTGEVKHVIEFSNISGTAMTIVDPTLRTSVRLRDLSTTLSDFSDIEMDDVITIGYSTGVSIFSEAVDSLLETYTTKSVKATLKEDSALFNEMYKELLDELKSDKVGRVAIDSIQRVQRVPNYASRLRR